MTEILPNKQNDNITKWMQATQQIKDFGIALGLRTGRLSATAVEFSNLCRVAIQDASQQSDIAKAPKPLECLRKG